MNKITKGFDLLGKIIEAIFFKEKQEVNIYKVSQNQKKKILIYGGSFMNNGITASLVALLSNMLYEKFEVYLITDSNVNSVNFLRTMERIPKNVQIISVKGSSLKLIQNQYKLLSYKTLRKIFKKENYAFLGNSKYDIAINYSGYKNYWACFIAFSNANLKYIYLHSDMKQEQKNKPYMTDYHLLYSLYRNKYDKLITVSNSSYEANKNSFLDIEEKFINVNNPIDYKSIISLSKQEDILWKSTLDTNKVNFINIARYSTEKGQDKLIQAFSHIVQNNSNVHLYLVGHGILYKTLKLQIKNLELQKYITITDNIENPFPLLSSCDCFILSSHYEGQGLVLLESMVLGIPCISTDIPGPQSVLADKRGLLVDDSVKGLIGGMETYLEGAVPQQAFDCAQYTQDAMCSFYRAVT